MSGRALRGWALAAWALWCAGAALAQGDDSARRFTHKDWELACDNTRTCRAAGYQVVESAPSMSAVISPVAMRITRAAGPNTPVAMTLRIDVNAVSDRANSLSTSYRLQVGAVDLRGLTMDRNWLIEFTPAQARIVMTEMLKPKVSEALVWFGDDTSGSPDGRLSLAGLNAVLLKMDEWQGRVGTRGALVRRGGKTESSVLPSVPMPAVKVATPVATQPADADLAERIFPLLDLTEINCANKEEIYGKNQINAGKLEVNRLTSRRVLLSVSACSADRLGIDLPVPHWIANDKPPYAPQAIEAVGEFDKKTMSISGGYASGPTFDCWEGKVWHFNGQKFVLTSSISNNDPCRDFGGWPLENYVARVIPANSNSSKP